jgi:orotate phosphoribosyltransferase
MGMVSIFTYGFEAADKACAAAGLPTVSLTNYTNLISIAVEKGLVGEEDQKILFNWRMDPANWQPGN